MYFCIYNILYFHRYPNIYYYCCFVIITYYCYYLWLFLLLLVLRLLFVLLYIIICYYILVLHSITIITILFLNAHIISTLLLLLYCYYIITIITILLYVIIYIYYKSTCISSGSAQRLQVSAAADARRDGERPAASWIDLGVNFLEVKGKTVQLGVRYQYLLYIHDILYIIHIYLYIYIYLFMYIHARACIYSVERHVTVLWSLSKVMLWLCPVMYIELDRS